MKCMDVTQHKKISKPEKIGLEAWRKGELIVFFFSVIIAEVQ